MDEIRGPKAFTDQLLQSFLSGGRPRLLEMQPSRPSVSALKVPALPTAPRLMCPVSPFECTGADLPGLWETLKGNIFKIKASQSIIFTLMD